MFVDSGARGWNAQLSLRFAHEDGRTIVRQRRSGPLLMQKPLYPEGPELCHAVVLHPPGGIAGGDRLEMALELGAGSHALVTFPGATRWYRSAGPEAMQQVTIRAHDAAIEWLPPETIVYDAARARSELTVELSGKARFLGWEILCLGRTASGEKFARGVFRQRTTIRRDGRLLWSDRTCFEGGDQLLDSPVGFASRTIAASFVLAGPPPDAEALAACRAVVPTEPGGGPG